MNVVQSIFVNDEEVAKFEQEFNLAEVQAKIHRNIVKHSNGAHFLY